MGRKIMKMVRSRKYTQAEIATELGLRRPAASASGYDNQRLHP